MPSQTHQLAAIMLVRDPSPKAMAAGDRNLCEGGFTDIVWYTKLMGDDECVGLSMLREYFYIMIIAYLSSQANYLINTPAPQI